MVLGSAADVGFVEVLYGCVAVGYVVEYVGVGWWLVVVVKG